VTVDTLSYDPLLVTCFNGLIEEGHPYSFIALNASKEMLEDEVIKLMIDKRVHRIRLFPS